LRFHNAVRDILWSSIGIADGWSKNQIQTVWRIASPMIMAAETATLIER
jgi:hypothetical protein